MEATLKIDNEQSRRACAPGPLRSSFSRAIGYFACVLVFVLTLLGPFAQNAFAEIVIPAESDQAPVKISADDASRWREGGYEVLLLHGECKFQHGTTIATSKDAVVWLDLAKQTDENQRDKVIIYAESDVSVSLANDQHRSINKQDAKQSGSVIRDRQWLGRMVTFAGIDITVGSERGKPSTDSPIFKRAKQYRRTDLIGQVMPVQWIDTESPSQIGNSIRNNVDWNMAQLPDIPALNESGNAGDASRWQTLPSQGVPLESEFSAEELWNDTPKSNTGGSQKQFRQPLNNQVQPGYGFPGSGNANPGIPGPTFNNPALGVPSASETRVRFLPRGGRAPSLKSFPSPSGNEQIWIVTGGVKVVVESDELVRLNSRDPEADNRIVIEADEVVAWTNSLDELRADGQPAGPSGKRWELYMEGNIVFASGRRVVYSDRMYYDTTLNRGTILNAEMLTPVPEYAGLVRLKSDVLQQVDQNTFQAYGAAVTSSRMGVPRYWLQSNNILVTQSERNAFDPVTGRMLVDPQTGLPQTESDYELTSRGNSLYVGQVPIFYWPTLKTDLSDSSYYLNNIQFKNDSVYGMQVLTEFDMYQLLGIRNPPTGTDWTLDADYLSDRGPALGTNYKYQRANPRGNGGSYRGELDVWGIHDNGLDNLGLDRRALVPESEFRGRAKYRHRHNFGDGFQLTAEVGYISDRDFLEQYYEREWDFEKDQSTRLQLSKRFREQSFHLEGSTRLNRFFMQTESLPKFDHFLIGRNLFDRATWHSHSQVGYQKLRAATFPDDPANLAKFAPLAGEADREGLKAMTRQEIDFPFNIGPVKTVPYLMGEMSYWGEDLTGDSLSRSFGQVGIRSSLPIWRADNSIQSELLNVNGLAHKVTFDTDIFFADASEDLQQLPRYGQLDDDAQEAFRRRFAFDTFGGAIPNRFDDRLYAFRSNQQGNVTSPVSEIADDLFAVNFGVRQRWQTKRGAPGNQRIVDYISFDVEATYFPKAERDNFGADVGLVDYDFKWHIGDRFSVLSDGYFDFFGQGLRTGSIGLLTSRPGVGSLYAGFRSIEGPITSNVLLSAYNYRLSEKWILTAGSTFDLGPAGNLGQRFMLTRIGESFLIRAGLNSDISRDSVGFVFGIEPRFYARSKATNLGGVDLPPVGSQGLE